MSYRPASPCSLGCWYDNPLLEWTLSPSQGSMNSATALLSRGSVLLYSNVYRTVSKFRGLRVYSMNKTGGRRKLFLTSANVACWGSRYSLSTFSRPCFGVKPVYNYGHDGTWMMQWFIERHCLSAFCFFLPEFRARLSTPGHPIATAWGGGGREG